MNIYLDAYSFIEKVPDDANVLINLKKSIKANYSSVSSSKFQQKKE